MNQKPKPIRHAMQTALVVGLALGAGLAATFPATARAAATQQAQAKQTVRGTVVDETGEPLIGVSVIIDGTTTGVVTDLDGNFSLPCGAADKLRLSYIGYQTLTVPVAGQTTLSIQMKPDAEAIEEVVVVGYGTQKKATLTGAVAVVGAQQMESKGSLSSPVQALQGQVPGVIITRGSSAPGEESWNMSLRGAVSKNSAAPLIIIDGVEYESVNELRLLNPSDIESMNFLKDAAASIYGSKAAGGVVLVTTKKAKEGKVRVDYSGSVSLKTIGLSAELMNLSQWADAVIQARTNDGYGMDDTWLKYATMARQYQGKYIDLLNSGNPMTPAFNDVADFTFFDTDWQDVMWGSSYSTQHDLALSGGTDKSTFRFSLGYMYDNSNLKWGNNSNQRVNMRLNNSFQLAKNLKLESAISFNRQDQVAPTQIGKALTTNTQQPGFPTSTTDGKPYGWGTGWYTPNWLCELGGDNKLKVQALNISETLSYKITEYLKLTGVFGYNTSYATRDTKSEPVQFYNYAGTQATSIYPLQQDSYYTTTNSNTDFYSFQVYGNWNHTFGSHDVSLMAGWQYNLKQYAANGVSAKDIQPSMEVVNGSGTVSIASATRWEEALMSYYARANYAYKSRYMLEGQVRYDGSSKFQPGNRWAAFWGVSGGWRVTEEKWMKPATKWLTDLKLRASYGNVGNQSGIDRYSGTQLYNFHQGNGALIGGQLLSYLDTNGKLVSTDRTWEKVHNYNVGLDFTLFNGKITGSAETFWKKVNNMLIDVIYPAILGDSAPTANYGSFKAHGYEGQITYKDKIGKVGYHIGGTFTYATNELTDNGGSGAIKSGVRSDREGYPLNSVFGLRYCGKIQNDEQLALYKQRYAGVSTVGNIGLLRVGDNMFEDVNGDHKLTADDYVYLGTDDPKMQFSFNLGADYAGFDLNIVFQGAADRTVWRTDNNGNPDIWKIPMRAVYMNGSNHFVGNVWSLDNPTGRYPSLTNQGDINSYNYQCSSWSVENGSYLRCKNITLGWTAPQSLLKKLRIVSALRLYITGTDLFEFSAIHDGWDPEARRNISNASRYPFLRTYTFGANISF